LDASVHLPICSRSAIQASVTNALEQTDLICRLLPRQANLGKRLVKTPKIYFRDSGQFHTPCGIPSAANLMTNPKLGASWEGFALEEIMQA
jgi:predicted AAA+ superfamily ATPase